MFERNIFDEYKLYCEQRFKFGEYEGFTAGNRAYIAVSVEQIENEELNEMTKMASHLYSQGDTSIGTFVPTRNNSLIGFIDGNNCVLFQLPLIDSRKKGNSIGTELATFHQKGRSYQMSRKGKDDWWKDFWTYRLSQLDQLYGQLSKEKTKTSFDKAFMVSFPYYLGLTENAVQYIVDSDIDLGPANQYERKTVCHFQFSDDSWLHLNEHNHRFKNPIDFVYDYPSRDLAEWIRNTKQKNANPFSEIQSFINDYGKEEEISPRSWRLIYGRLLFPVHYFQVVEGYYRSVDDEERDLYEGKLYDLFVEEEKNEQFLRNFQTEVIPSVWKQYVPEVDWLANKRNKQF